MIIVLPPTPPLEKSNKISFNQNSSSMTLSNGFSSTKHIDGALTETNATKIDHENYNILKESNSLLKNELTKVKQELSVVTRERDEFSHREALVCFPFILTPSLIYSILTVVIKRDRRISHSIRGYDKCASCL